MKTRKLNCIICGKEFETARPNKKYCSLICREAGKQLKRIYWENANPNYNTTYYQEHKKSVTVMHSTEQGKNEKHQTQLQAK